MNFYLSFPSLYPIAIAWNWNQVGFRAGDSHWQISSQTKEGFSRLSSSGCWMLGSMGFASSSLGDVCQLEPISSPSTGWKSSILFLLLISTKDIYWVCIALCSSWGSCKELTHSQVSRNFFFHWLDESSRTRPIKEVE